VVNQARDHGEDLLAPDLESLQGEQSAPLHPDVERFSGILPDETADDEALYREHLERKHG
jgi:hypothetical protein